MKFQECWIEKETGKWIYQFEGTTDEIETLRCIEEETYMTISEIVEMWLNWSIKNPKAAMKLMREWEEEENENHKKCDQM